MGGRSINKEVPMRILRDPSSPNTVSKGTINTSAPAPINPAAKPLMIPVIVNPKI